MDLMIVKANGLGLGQMPVIPCNAIGPDPFDYVNMTHRMVEAQRIRTAGIKNSSCCVDRYIAKKAVMKNPVVHSIQVANQNASHENMLRGKKKGFWF